MHLILRGRDLYAKEPTGLELDTTIYALDSTTIDLCLNLFDWAPFRSTKAAVKIRNASGRRVLCDARWTHSLCT
jgi:hypothetical protein